MSASEWVAAIRCPVCNCMSFNTYKKVHSAPYLMVEFCNGWLPVAAVSTYIKCAGCGLVIQSPRMSDERINEYYASGLYRKTLSLTEQTKVVQDDEMQRAETLKCLIDGLVFESHIDIGSSNNYFLDLVNSPIKCGVDLANEAPMVVESAELVSAIHVLEHVTNPVKFLAECASMSTKYLLIEVPNADPLRFAHLYYFPPELLFHLVEDNDFHIIKQHVDVNTTVLAMKNG